MYMRIGAKAGRRVGSMWESERVRIPDGGGRELKPSRKTLEGILGVKGYVYNGCGDRDQI
jgi:hypothetical protein